MQTRRRTSICLVLLRGFLVQPYALGVRSSFVAWRRRCAVAVRLIGGRRCAFPPYQKPNDLLTALSAAASRRPFRSPSKGRGRLLCGAFMPGQGTRGDQLSVVAHRRIAPRRGPHPAGEMPSSRSIFKLALTMAACQLAGFGILFCQYPGFRWLCMSATIRM